MKVRAPKFLRASLFLTLAAARGQKAETVARLDEGARAIFRDHLLRLDGAARSRRFGARGLEDEFLESYSRNIDFNNTAIFVVFAHGQIRASAELRSLARDWGETAELAVLFEPAWKGAVETLCREAFLFAAKVGLLELYTYCDLANGCSLSVMRILGKEKRYAPCGSYPAFEPCCDDEADGCAVPASNDVLFRMVRTRPLPGATDEERTDISNTGAGADRLR